MHSQKIHNKKLILPVLILLAGCLDQAAVLYHSYRTNLKQVRVVTELNATTYAYRLHLMVVVTDIYPEAGNEAGKIDLIHDESRGEICRYGRDKNIVTMQGSFDLKQGGRGIAIRNSVYLECRDETSAFWGFAIVIIRVPEVFEKSVQALTQFGYDYCLTKTVSPFSNGTEVVSSSGNILKEPITFEFEFCGSTFGLEVMPTDGWSHGWNILPQLVFGIRIILLLMGLTVIVLVVERHREILKNWR